MDLTDTTQPEPRRIATALFDRLRTPPREHATSGRVAFWLAVAAVAVLAVALRLVTLSSRSLWTDEGYSFWFASQTLHTLWHDVPYYETHPPFYYTLLHGWMMLAGSTEVALRMPSVIASVLTVVLLAASGKLLRAGPTGDRVALLAAFLFAINKGSIEFAQQARPYALETLAAALMTLCSVRLLTLLHARLHVRIHPLDVPKAPSIVPAAIGLTLSAALTLWLHNTAMFIVFAVWVGLATTLLIDRTRIAPRMLLFGVTGAVAVALWSPYLPFLLFQSRNVASNFWIQLNWLEFPAAWTLAAGGKWAFVPMAAFAALGLRAVWRAQRSLAVHLACVLVLPFTIVVLISCLVRPIFMDRLFAWMAPEFVALAALGIVAGLGTLRRPGAATLVVTGLIAALSAMQVVKFYRHPSEDWRALTATIATHAQPGDLVIVDAGEAQPPLEFYARNQPSFPPMRVVPADFPAPGLARPYRAGNLGVPSPTDADRPTIRAASDSHRRIWLVTRGVGTYDPTGIVRGEIVAHKPHARMFVDSESYTLELFE
ncbi:glycosyltransferase family 39 protein [Paraburkholderia sp.]|uniref:glycosyltransferase family 39 protein n=1 Tax=Paraburkholderia sp. TaxID=1926495 RepID=UPI003D6DF3FC